MRSSKGKGRVCVECQLAKVKCIWPLGPRPGPDNASTSGTIPTNLGQHPHPSVEVIHEVAEAIQGMSEHQAELGWQQAETSQELISMSHHALKVIDRLATAIMEEVWGLSLHGVAHSGEAGTGSGSG